MTNTKLAKRSFCVSLMALILCFSMLMGTTFAWFTDSVTSENNIIKSGSLKVAMDYSNKYEGDATTWTDASKGAIFNYQYWEPGYSEVKFIKITNAGDLALQFKLDIIPAVAAVAGEINLADVIDVYSVIADNADELAALATLNLASKDSWATVASAGTLTSLMGDVDGAARGYLLPKSGVGAVTAEGLGLTAAEFAALPQGEIIVALKLTMKETAGNEYQNLKVGDGFSVRLMATQFEAEEDAFDNSYDQDSEYINKDVNGFAEVGSMTELQVALEQGSNIKLTEDITLDSPLVFSAPASTFAMRSTPAPIILDLNGNKITADVKEGDMIVNEGNLLLTGGTVELLTVNGGATINNKGNLTLKNVAIKGAPIAADDGYPAYAVKSAGNLTIEAGTAISADRGCLFLSGTGETVINGGSLTNNDISTILVDRAFTSHVIVVGYGANNKLTINDGTFSHLHTSTSGGVVVNNWSAVTVDINGGSFSGGNYYGKWDNLSDYGYGSTKTPFCVKGGTFTGMDSKFVASGYVAEKNENGTYRIVLPQSNFGAVLDQAQAGDTVSVPAGDYTFLASNLKAGVTLKCEEGTTFNGKSSLNVNGATVIGATFSNPSDSVVAGTVNGTFKDCVFTGSNALRWCYAGDTVVFENCVFDGDLYGVHFDGGAKNVTFINCTFSGFNALAGEIELATFTGCTFVANGKSNYNGINMWGNTTLTDCTFVFDGTAGYEWVDACGDNLRITITNCVVTDGANEKPIETVVGDYGVGNTITVDGNTLA